MLYRERNLYSECLAHAVSIVRGSNNFSWDVKLMSKFINELADSMYDNAMTPKGVILTPEQKRTLAEEWKRSLVDHKFVC